MEESIHVTLMTFLLTAFVSAFVAVVIHIMGFLVKKFSPAVKASAEVAASSAPVADKVVLSGDSETEVVAAIMAVKKFAKN